MLESRIDNVIYRMGFAITRAQGRQMANHGLVRVNGRKVDVPSYLLKAGDVITFNDKEATKKYLAKNLELNEGWAPPSWVHVDLDKREGKVVRIPARDEIAIPVNEQLIIELYSK
jgi:small subunit ribosomal protein S4